MIGTHPAEPATPLAAADRLHTLDILRGFALLGMILVHFHQKMRLETPGLEDLIGWVVYVGVEQKSWGTFAFLFGVGFAVLLRRLEARGLPVVALYLRRLAVLAALGAMVEVCFGFHVLLEYAIWGVPLLFMRNWSTRALLVAAAVAAMARPLLAALMAIYSWAAASPETAAAATAAGAAGPSLAELVHAAEQQGSYGALLEVRAAEFAAGLFNWRTLIPSSDLTLFLLGLLALRHGVFDEPRRHLRLIVGWMVFGALSWATAWLLLYHIPDLPVPRLVWPLRQGLGLVRDQWLSFTYIGGLTLLLAYRPVWTRRLEPMGRAGRMALTNYILQAAVLDYLASGYGVGLKLRPLAYVGATAIFFSVQVLLSGWWLARYRFGPFEWLWRTLTYWRIQPLRRVAAPLGEPLADRG